MSNKYHIYIPTFIVQQQKTTSKCQKLANTETDHVLCDFLKRCCIQFQTQCSCSKVLYYTQITQCTCNSNTFVIGHFTDHGVPDAGV